MHKLEYIWLDGYQPEQSLRSKVKVHDIGGEFPDWSFDGSSTLQAEGGSSDCLLEPVSNYGGSKYYNSDNLVMCQVRDAKGAYHDSNTRHFCIGIQDEWWFGFEQEYFLTDQYGDILGWEGGTPKPQGPYYCAVGHNNVKGRQVSEEHMNACIDAGIQITGTNAEVALGQWEYQVFGKGIKAGDDLWVSRYLLILIAEKHGLAVNFHPKPKKGDWNGSGMHTNFSNMKMRHGNTPSLFIDYCEKLGKVHDKAIKVYGSDNDMRLTGDHETQNINTFSYGESDRGASIRIPLYTIEHQYNGYLEDRRPASNADPYKIMHHIVSTLEDEGWDANGSPITGGYL